MIDRGTNVTPETFQGEVKTMWEDGPDRRISSKSVAGARMPLESGAYGGSYVCQACQSVTVGVYIAKLPSLHAGKWICGDCRNTETSANAKPRRGVL